MAAAAVRLSELIKRAWIKKKRTTLGPAKSNRNFQADFVHTLEAKLLLHVGGGFCAAFFFGGKYLSSPIIHKCSGAFNVVVDERNASVQELSSQDGEHVEQLY